MFQDLKIEIEAIKKNTNQGNYRNRNHEKMIRNHKCKHKQRNTSNERENLKHWDTIEEIDSSVKENIKSNKSLIQNIQEIWDTMKRPNLRIIGIEEGDSTQKHRKYI